MGEGVTNVAVGDTVILHPQPSCGLCTACRAGRDMQCDNAFFPGLSNDDGGMAEYLRTTARACVKLDPSTNPADVAALADAGITAYHAVRKALPLLHPGTTAVVQGAGGLGHQRRAHRVGEGRAAGVPDGGHVVDVDAEPETVGGAMRDHRGAIATRPVAWLTVRARASSR